MLRFNINGYYFYELNDAAKDVAYEDANQWLEYSAYDQVSDWVGCEVESYFHDSFISMVCVGGFKYTLEGEVDFSDFYLTIRDSSNYNYSTDELHFILEALRGWRWDFGNDAPALLRSYDVKYIPGLVDDVSEDNNYSATQLELLNRYFNDCFDIISMIEHYTGEYAWVLYQDLTSYDYFCDYASCDDTIYDQAGHILDTEFMEEV